jgi:hypothetical protein
MHALASHDAALALANLLLELLCQRLLRHTDIGTCTTGQFFSFSEDSSTAAEHQNAPPSIHPPNHTQTDKKHANPPHTHRYILIYGARVCMYACMYVYIHTHTHTHTHRSSGAVRVYR